MHYVFNSMSRIQAMLFTVLESSFYPNEILVINCEHFSTCKRPPDDNNMNIIHHPVRRKKMY